MGVSFPPFYAWTGMFLSLYLFLGAMFSMSSANRIVTRFTEEPLSVLVSVIFIYKAVRNRVADFAPVIAIFLGLGISWLLIGHYGIEEIDMDFLPFVDGDITATTLATDVRPWLTDLSDINVDGIGLAVVGGMFAFIVLFFDQNIIVRLVNAREHNLKKGYGYDMDMMAL
eukprot:jgi/Tetstr1/459530/TSEL_004896.t1